MLAACRNSQWARVLDLLPRAILNETDPQGHTALHHAADKGKDEDEAAAMACQSLVGAGASVFAVDSSGWTPLITAAHWGGYKVCEVLVQGESPLAAVDIAGNSAMHHAASGNHPDIVQLLVLAGAGVDVFNKNGETPLHLAATEDNVAVAKVLLAAKANPKITDAGGNDALWFAEHFDSNGVLELLRPSLRKGTDIMKDINTLFSELTERVEFVLQNGDATAVVFAGETRRALFEAGKRTFEVQKLCVHMEKAAQ